jgi:hypothetical protein
MWVAIIVVGSALLFFISTYLVNKHIPDRCNHDCAHCPLQRELAKEKEE